MDFYSRSNPPKRKPQKNFGKSKTEVRGYIPAEKKITSMIEAGQRLEQSRIDQYDYQEEVPDDFLPDPTRNPGYDMADAQADYEAALFRLTQAQEAAVATNEVPDKNEQASAEESKDVE
jgi:hypothetical protein